MSVEEASVADRNYESVRTLISMFLLCFLVLVAAYLWYIDLLAGQRVFGILLSGILVALSMLVYVYRKPSHEKISKTWLAIGYLSLAILLSLSIALSLGYVA